MFTKLISLTSMLLISTALYSAQPAFHSYIGYNLNNVVAKESGLNPWLTAPLTGVISHVVADSYIGEGGIYNQVDIGLIRNIIMWQSLKDKDKDLFLWCAFWSLFPDIIDKSVGDNKVFHGSLAQPMLDVGELTNTAEEFSVLLFVIQF